ncbi:MAG: CehA/McbA family metallohydrolase [Bryobacterales bacterium]|nr:CehA/McbA family metallohydrolase [Bryobacterales bacterium]
MGRVWGLCSLSPKLGRGCLAAGFALALAGAQLRESLRPAFAAQLAVVVRDASDGRVMPARVYLFKDGRPFRLSPVECLLPLRVDLFYRERLWRQTPRPRTLEITANDESHFALLNGRGEFDLPAGRYRVEAYRGTLYRPATQEFELRAGEKRTVELRLAAVEGKQAWLSGDDHIHLVRAPEDDPVFLGWLEAEDLSVGNFLQLQRQQDAATQYGFGEGAEARSQGFSIRSGIEARSHFYGHVNLLGVRELIRPISAGSVYANSPEAYPFPLVLFERAKQAGGTVGYAHFDGSQKHSALLMDVALERIDFVEVFQSGVLKTGPWYELLNAGFRVTGIAGSDFPVPLNTWKPWPRHVPLLGPERTLVKASPGLSAYENWAAGIRAGNVVVSNGPLLEISVNGRPPGARVNWSGAEAVVEGEAVAAYHGPIERVEIVVNGRVAAVREGNGENRLRLPFQVKVGESSWVAARAAAKSAAEPKLQAHTNAVYLLRDGRAVSVGEARQALRRRWEEEARYYLGPELTFAREAHRKELRERVEAAARVLGQTAR